MPPAPQLLRNTEKLKQCQSIYVINQKEEPTSVANRLQQFKSNTAARHPTANERTFDLFPNMIVPTTEIMLTSLEYATTLGAEMTGHSKISTATICFYQIFVLYGYFLINDCYVRPNPSNAAKNWLQSSSRTRMIEFIKCLPVPAWMLPLFNQWAASSSNKAANVFIVPTAASVRLETHYGRFFPANFFTLLHDLSATLPGNSDPTIVFSKLLYTQLSSVYLQGETRNYHYSVCIADLLGFTADTNQQDHEYINSRIFQAFESVFNPVLFRDQQRRKTFATTSLMPTEFNSPDEFNVYDYMFAFNEQNDSELFVLLETVAAALSSPASFTKSIGQAIATRSGIAIFDHGYCDYLLPTWTTTHVKYDHKIKGPADPKKFTKTLVSNAKRAIALTFLSGKPTTSTSKTTTAIAVNVAAHTEGSKPTTNKWKYPDDTEVTDTNVITQTRAVPPTYLGPLSTAKNVDHDFPDYISFDQKRHVSPEYVILDVSGDAEESAWLIGLSGKIIETFEIDGSTVAHPDTRNNTANQNHQQGESMIPVRYTISPLDFYPRDANNALIAPRDRADNVSDDRIICSTHLLDRTTVGLPVATDTIRDTAIPTGFPGLMTMLNINWISRFQYFLGFKTVNRLHHKDDDDSIPNMPTHRLYVFSPYMYTGYEDHKDTSFETSKMKAYWVTNLRSHFGSDTPLLDATHPFRAHPLI